MAFGEEGNLPNRPQGVRERAPGFPRDPFRVLPESCPARVFSEMAWHGVRGGEEFP